MNQIIRNIQIDLILENQNPIIDCFDGIWNELSVIDIHTFHTNGGELIYYNSNKEWIFFRDDMNDRFWCSYNRYWTIIKLNFNLEYSDIKVITKLLVENKLNCNISNVLNLKQLQQLPVQKALDTINLTNIVNPRTVGYSEDIAIAMNKI